MFDNEPFESSALSKQHAVSRALDFDDKVSVGSKRKRNQGREAGRQTSSEEDGQLFLSPSTAALIAILLVTFNPAFETCEMVAKFLLGVDEITGTADSNYDLDLLGGLYSSVILCAEETILHGEAIKQLTLSEYNGNSQLRSVDSIVKVSGPFKRFNF